MKKTITLLILLLISVFPNVFGENVTIEVETPGTLKTTLTNAGHTLGSITGLTITGSIDARDFATIRSSIGNLATLDISEVAIEAYTGSGGTAITNNVYPANTIPEWAFYHLVSVPQNEKLTTVYLGQATIGKMAFYKCAALTNIYWGGNLTKIEDSAFGTCTGLINIEIPRTVEEIEQNAFSNCTNMETFGFESSAKLEVLYKGVIPNDSKVTSVTLPASITVIQPDALYNYSGAIEVDENNPNYSGSDGALYSKDKTILHYVPKYQTTFSIAETTVVIGERAFYENEGLTSITLPNTLDSIAKDAFCNTLLDEIVIDPVNSNLRVIGQRGLARCKNLTTLIIPKNMKNFGDASIGYNSGLLELHCYIEEPFEVSGYVFDGICRNSTQTSCETLCTLLVPEGLTELYKNTSAWNTFDNIEPIRPEEEKNLFILTPYPSEEDPTMFVYELSPNGKYAVGRSNAGAFRWDIENSTADKPNVTYLDYGNSDAFGDVGTSQDVTDSGIVAGSYVQSYGGNTVVAPGIWEDGAWTSLLTESSYVNLPTVSAMANHGKTVVGSIMPNYTDIEPYSWNKSEEGLWGSEQNWSYPAGGQGARIHNISKNANIACGWSVNESTNGNRVPIMWTSLTQYKIIGDGTRGEARRISDNGKYIAMTYNSAAALYKVDTDEIVIIKNNAEAMDVSDNGIVVGYYNLANNARKGFIWTEEDGFADLYDILALYTPDGEIEEFQQSYLSLDVASSISADGKVIAGWKAYTEFFGHAWVLKLKDDYQPLKKPASMTAEAILSERNKVLIKWSAPENDSGKSITGYTIYRNQEVIAILNASATEYTDDLSATGWNDGGTVNYAMTTLYENDLRSPRTDEIPVLIFDNYNIPFVDDFEYIDMMENYWTTDRNFVYNFWFINPTYPNGYKGTSMTFSTTISGTEYNESLISKPFDARNEANVYLSYLTHINVLQNISDKIYVEIQKISENEEWVTVNEHAIAVSDWQFHEVDLSSIVAGKIFRLRFRAAGNDGSQYYFELDNLQIRTENKTAPAPQNTLTELKEDGIMNLSWQNPSGAYGLSYCMSEPFQAVGNKGATFIGANKFDPTDLSIYKDKYLTSISAYITEEAGYGNQTILSLAVFENGTRVCTQPVSPIELEAWNTFALNTPVKIDTTNTLYIGIEVVSHNAEEMPLSIDQSESTYDGKGNLFSEDGGVTWQKLSDSGLTHNWCIIANVRNEATGSVNDRDLGIWGYNVFRNGQKLNSGLMQFAQTYSDDITSINATEVCYTVQAYYADKAWSAMSEETCASTVDIKYVAPNELIIYPNPVEDYLVIYGLDNKAGISVYDMQGRLIISQHISPSQKIEVKQLPAGVYILKAHNGTNIYETKFIKK